MEIKLRPQQVECVKRIDANPTGRHVIACHVSYGKTVIMAKIKRNGRTLIMSHREELVNQPLQYFDCTTGVEQRDRHSNHTEEVVSASVQSLVRRLKQYSPNEFDTLIVDECLTPETEILTENGYVRFDKLKDEKVAQMDDNFNISFVRPSKKIKRWHSGEIIDVRIHRESHVYMTPNHQQILYKKGKIYSKNAENLNEIYGTKLIVSGKATGNKKYLSALDRIAIAMQADGCFQRKMEDGTGYWSISLSRERKIERIIALINESGIRANEINGYHKQPQKRRWLLWLPSNITKNLSSYFNISDMSYEYAREFINEMQEWDGSRCNSLKNNNPYYSSTVKENTDFINAVGILAGYSSYQTIGKDDRPQCKNQSHRLHMRNIMLKDAQSIEKIYKNYSGFVYCVEVPTHKIIIRSQGFTFITGNCHHAAAPTYRTIIDYFNPPRLLGFSATPARNDGNRLDNVFDDVLYEFDIKQGIEAGYLSPIKVAQVKLDYDLSEVKIQRGDFVPTELAEAMRNTAPGIAETYFKYAKGVTLIFAPSVEVAHDIADIIPGCEVIDANTPKDKRKAILEAYERREIPCIANNLILTEGYSNPQIDTIIWSRPTLNNKSMLIQAIGRGVRLRPGKEYCKVIDCIGSTRMGLVSPASIIGYDMPEAARKRMKDGIEIDLMEYEDYCNNLSDVPEEWVKSYKEIDIWAKQNKYNLHDMALRKRGNGELVIGLPNGVYYSVPPVDVIGNCTFKNGRVMKAQDAIDALFKHLMKNHSGEMAIWSKRRSNRWRKDPITDKQRRMVEHIKNIDLSGVQVRELTAGEASIIINEVNIRRKNK